MTVKAQLNRPVTYKNTTNRAQRLYEIVDPYQPTFFSEEYIDPDDVWVVITDSGMHDTDDGASYRCVNLSADNGGLEAKFKKDDYVIPVNVHVTVRNP